MQLLCKTPPLKRGLTAPALRRGSSGIVRGKAEAFPTSLKTSHWLVFRALDIESISSTEMIANLIEEETLMGSVSVVSSLTHGNVVLTEISVPHMHNHSNDDGVLAFDVEMPEDSLIVAVSSKDDGEVVSQMVGIYCDSISTDESGVQHAILSLYHNQNNCPEYYAAEVFLSIPLARIPCLLKPGDDVSLRINTYSGPWQRTFTIAP